MDASTRRAALRTAAKVALGSIFFGCGASAIGAKSAEVEALPMPEGPAPIVAPAKRESLAYCKAILAFVDQGRGYSEAIPTLGTCCGANDYPRGGACTPWGPPTPPDFFELEVT